MQSAGTGSSYVTQSSTRPLDRSFTRHETGVRAFIQTPEVPDHLVGEADAIKCDGRQTAGKLDEKTPRLQVPPSDLVAAELSRLSSEEGVAIAPSAPRADASLAQKLASAEAVARRAKELLLDPRKTRLRLARRHRIAPPAHEGLRVALARRLERREAAAQMRALLDEPLTPPSRRRRRVGTAPRVVPYEQAEGRADVALHARLVLASLVYPSEHRSGRAREGPKTLCQQSTLRLRRARHADRRRPHRAVLYSTQHA